jgi:hypothetical protein
MAIRSNFEYRRTEIEAKRFEQALTSARERSPSNEVDPRIHEAMIESLGSELAVLREQLAQYEAVRTSSGGGISKER